MLVTIKKHPLHRCGAEAARGADNPEVTGSKPVAGILQFVCFTEVHSQSLVTINQLLFAGVAQRQRAGLIILRSHDRNVSPELFNSGALQNHSVNRL